MPLRTELDTWQKVNKICEALVSGVYFSKKSQHKEKPATFKRELFMRMNQMEKYLPLKKQEKDALRCFPDDRSEEERTIAEQVRTQVAAKLEKTQSELQIALDPKTTWGPTMRADRVGFLGAACTSWFAKDAAKDGSKKDGNDDDDDDDGDDYAGLNLERMRRAGWYVPTDLNPGSLYPGLRVKRSVKCAPDFMLDPKKEDKPSDLL